jgi:Tol biopolymer transport system component
MDRIGVLSEEDAIIIGAAICDALTFLDTRSQPIIHRDIKPGNVKITSNGQIYLVDFGLAKIIQGSQATTTGARAMTPGYSPPEQYGTARTDHRSDLFSLGATLYAALTGAIPEDALARAMDQAELTTIRKHNPKISRRLAAVLEKSLEVRPDDRYQSAEEFKQALLSVRGNTRRRTGDFTVEPPPEGSIVPQNDSGGEGPPPISNGSLYDNNDFSPLPLPASTPLNSPAPSYRLKSRSRRRRKFWPGILLLILIMTIAGGLAYTFFPSWPSQALTLLRPSPTNFVPVVAELNTPTLSPTLNIFHTPTSSPTIEPSLTPTDTPVPTATNTPTAIPPSPTPTQIPTPQGGGGQIAFASDRSGSTQIWIMNSDGSYPHQLTDINGGACQPDWSPDGKRLVFISPCARNQETYIGSSLFLIDADGSNQMALSTVPGGDFDPAWSPDGKKIAFTSLRSSGRPRIYVMDLDAPENTALQRLSDQYSRDLQPAWSPDGSKIAFVTTRKGASQIWIMDADGQNQEIFSRSGSAINSHPVWSPDSKVILFTQIDRPGAIPGLVAATYIDGEFREFRFNLGPIPVRDAKYSPDGLLVVCESWPQGNTHNIYVMAAGGANRVQLTDAGRFNFDPAWRPPVSTP